MTETPAPTKPMTSAQRLAVTLYALHSTTSRKLEDDVASYLSAGMSWRAIRDRVAADTGGEVTVSHESLRTWYGPSESTS